jgi:hypothetical protein
MMASQRAGSPSSLISGVEIADTQGTGMAGTDRAALPVGGGAGGAAIGRNVADRQRLAAVLNGRGHGFKDVRRRVDRPGLHPIIHSANREFWQAKYRAY